MKRLALAVVVAALASFAAAPAGRSADRSVTLGVYGGIGSWLDIFAGPVWQEPRSLVSGLKAHGVRTLYLQTSNYSQRTDLVRRAELAALLEAAHAAGIEVVAWYLPSFTDPEADARRSLAAIRFRTQTGGGFDSFALDIESSVVRSPALRNARLLDLSRRLRAAVGPSYALGAIIPSPRGMQLLPHYWPGFPYSDLYRIYDVFLPMAYFSYRARGTAPVARYVERSVGIIRARTGDPDVAIHVVGGISQRTGLAEARGFMQAVHDCRTLGFSLYDFAGTSTPAWRTLTAAAPPDDTASCS